MKRVWGYTLFWMGIGMLIMFFVGGGLLGVLLIAGTMLVSYLLFFLLIAAKNKKRTVIQRFLYLLTKLSQLFPDLRQEAQTYNFCGTPFTLQLTRLMFDFQTLFDLLCEWLTLIP